MSRENKTFKAVVENGILMILGKSKREKKLSMKPILIRRELKASRGIEITVPDIYNYLDQMVQKQLVEREDKSFFTLTKIGYDAFLEERNKTQKHRAMPALSDTTLQERGRLGTIQITGRG